MVAFHYTNTANIEARIFFLYITMEEILLMWMRECEVRQKYLFKKKRSISFSLFTCLSEKIYNTHLKKQRGLPLLIAKYILAVLGLS